MQKPVPKFSRPKAPRRMTPKITMLEIPRIGPRKEKYFFEMLTAIVFISKKDFFFLGPILGISSMVIFGVILLGAFGLLNLGTGFCMALVVFASGAILYDTSNVLHRYRTEQYVAAALALFASVGILFWYILQIVISMSNRR